MVSIEILNYGSADRELTRLMLRVNKIREVYIYMYAPTPSPVAGVHKAHQSV